MGHPYWVFFKIRLLIFMVIFWQEPTSSVILRKPDALLRHTNSLTQTYAVQSQVRAPTTNPFYFLSKVFLKLIQHDFIQLAMLPHIQFASRIWISLTWLNFIFRLKQIFLTASSASKALLTSKVVKCELKIIISLC